MKFHFHKLWKFKAYLIGLPIHVQGYHDVARRAGTRVTGGETVLNPWCMIGGVATAVCASNEYIM